MAGAALCCLAIGARQCSPTPSNTSVGGRDTWKEQNDASSPLQFLAHQMQSCALQHIWGGRSKRVSQEASAIELLLPK